MNNASKAVARSVTSLVKAATQGDENYTASSATETVSALSQLSHAARAVGATTGSTTIQQQ